MIDSDQLTEVIRQWIEIFTMHSMHAWMHFVRTSGLSMPQFGLLMNLKNHPTCTVTDVGEHMDITAAAASQLVDKLVQNGFLERAEDPKDRRVKMLTLTSRGRSLIAEGVEARLSWVHELVSALTPEEYETVGAALKSLNNAARRLEIKKPEKQA